MNYNYFPESHYEKMREMDKTSPDNYFPESHYEKMREMDKTSPDNYCSWVTLRENA